MIELTKQFSNLGLRMRTVVITLTMLMVGFTASALPPYQEAARPFLETYCFSCHGVEKQKSKVRFDEFTELTLDDAEFWHLTRESVEFEEMPPKDSKQPSAEERAAFLTWLEKGLTAPDLAPDDHQSLYDPNEGNRVDHDTLFDGSVKGPAWSPPRMWRRSQPQYDALMEQMWIIPKLRNDYALERDNPEYSGFGYAQPFPQMDPKHFTNYSGGVHADESALRGLLDSGHQVALRLTAEKPAFHPLTQPVIQVGMSNAKKKGRWDEHILDPPKRAEQFEPFLGKDALPTEADRHAAINHVFRLIIDRQASEAEIARYDGLLLENIKRSGPTEALRGLIVAVVVSPEFVFRMEVGMTEPDEHGRRMLSPRELTYAIAYALTDSGPDATLLAAAASGHLKTKDDVEREVRRIIADDSIEKLPKLRFWQEFFGYTLANEVFKDKSPHGVAHRPQYMIRDADQLVQRVLDQDKEVFRKLLTTERYFVGYPTAGGDDALRDKWIEQAQIEAQQAIQKAIAKAKDKGKDPTIKPPTRNQYSSSWLATQGKTIMPRARHNDEGYRSRSYAFVYGFEPKTMDWSPDQPMEIPDPRMGVLMHPAWLIAHSTNFDNDIVGRGYWIRKRLLAGSMPSIPIDVEAQIPEDHTKTLRQRMEVTRQEYCWKCHKRMDPLGTPFENFDHFGWYRTSEIVVDGPKNGVPVDSSGGIVFSGEPGLDTPVKDARELVTKLAGSERVRRSIIRHAFRFWMGRNEMLSDSPTLIAADKAYVDSDGSFNELIVSLLTSDSFLYRK